MSKITLKEFESFADLFQYYHAEKAKGKEKQWIDKIFGKNPKVKAIMNRYNDNISKLDKEADKIIKPYMKSKGFDLD